MSLYISLYVLFVSNTFGIVFNTSTGDVTDHSYSVNDRPAS